MGNNARVLLIYWIDEIGWYEQVIVKRQLSQTGGDKGDMSEKSDY